MPVQGWFNTPIYHNMVQSHVFEKIQNEFAEAEKILNDSGSFKHKPTWNPGTHQLSDITFNRNLFLDFNLKTFESELKFHVTMYKNILGIPQDQLTEYKIKSSWMTKTSTNEYAHRHNHKRADISGVYYYKTNGKDGSIVFINPIPQFESLLFDYITPEVHYEPEVGKIILFPGWLYHGVTPNYTKDDRLSISFDIFFKRPDYDQI